MESVQPKPNPPPSVPVAKVVLVGSTMVGKTSIMSRYSYNTFTETYVATIGIDFSAKSITLRNGQLCKLQIWDTAGQERFRNITTSYYRKMEVAIFLYDVTRKQTLEEITTHRADVAKVVDPIKYIVGNMTDLEHKREVTPEEGQKYADEHGCRYMEVSARTGDGVEALFDAISKDLCNKYYPGSVKWWGGPGLLKKS